MTEQEENELICEKLLGWVRAGTGESWGMPQTLWRTEDGLRGTPSFTDWAGAGLILDVFKARLVYVEVVGHVGDQWEAVMASLGRAVDATGPLAIRAATLAYLRDAPQVNARD